MVGGPVLAVAGWWWRRAASLRLAVLEAALLGGVFLAEGAVTYAHYLGCIGDAVVFCALGALLLAVLGATAAAARGSRTRGAGAAAAWLLLVLPLGAAGEVALHSLLG